MAVFCKTGKWATLQGASFLDSAALVGQGATTVAGSVVGATSVVVTTTAPASGVLGWFGATTTVSTSVPLIAAQPWILPTIIVVGTVSWATPMAVALVAKEKWSKTTKMLVQAFEEHCKE